MVEALTKPLVSWR